MIAIRFAVHILLIPLIFAGCGEDGVASGSGGAGGAAPAECAPPNRLVGDACREPGVHDDGCPAGTLGVGDGTCQPAGIPLGECGEGFMHDGDVGCAPVLPAGVCPPGMMAVPGDTQCQPVIPCAAGKWGDIPTDATTQHVDASYAGVDSDGSAAKPWTTIGDAIAAADDGATIAIAAGAYPEDVEIVGKPVVLWGVCPDDVEIIGTGAELAAVFIHHEGASGTTLRGLAITGAAHGILASGSERLLFDRVWVHDNAGRGVNVQDSLGSTTWTLRDSLIESNHEHGIFVSGSETTMERTLVRATSAGALGAGRGVTAQPNESGEPSVLVVHRSLVEDNHEAGVFVSSSDATIEGVVVRGTQPNATGARGDGIQVASSTATIRGSLFDANHDFGVFAGGSDVTVESTVVRGTLPSSSIPLGGGIHAEPADAPSIAVVRGSLVEDNHGHGISVIGSDATIESTVVRARQPNAADVHDSGVFIQCEADGGAAAKGTLRGSVVESSRGHGVFVLCADVTLEEIVVRETLPNAQGEAGRGIGIEQDPDLGTPSRVTLRSSVVAENREVGVFVQGSDVTIEASVVRDTSPDASGEVSRGMNIQRAVRSVGGPSTASVRSSLVEQTQEFGIVALSSNLDVDGCLVRQTRANALGLFGDGLSAIADGPMKVMVASTRIEDSARAGLSNFGAFVSLGDSTIQCAAFDLEGESFQGAPFSFEDRGGNVCGCPTAGQACLLETVGIGPPTPVTPVE